MKSTSFLVITGVSLLVGCAQALIPGGANAPVGHATLSLTPQVQGGGLRTQTVVPGFSRSDINHLQIKLFKVVGVSEQAVLSTGATPLMLDLPQASLSTQVSVGNLAADTTYRIRAYAYSAPGTANKISLDASSSVDVTVLRDDRPTLTNLPVQLVDQLFNGQATASNILVTDGVVAHAGTESLSVD